MSLGRTIAGVLIGLALASSASAAEPEVAKISVLRDGQVLLDGAPADAASLDRRLASVAKAHGVVWYYREGAGQEPTGAQGKAIDAVLSRVVPLRLSIKLSTQPDFSDVVDQNGRSVARPHQ